MDSNKPPVESQPDCQQPAMQTPETLSGASMNGSDRVGGGLIGWAPYRCLSNSVLRWIDSLTPQERESFYSGTLPLGSKTSTASTSATDVSSSKKPVRTRPH